MSFFGLGGGLKVFVSLLPSEKSVTVSHMPSWKVRRNPFALVQPNSNRKDDDSDDKGRLVPAIDKQVVRHDEDKVYIYLDNDDIHGVVTLTVTPGKQAEHLGKRLHFPIIIENDKKFSVMIQ